MKVHLWNKMMVSVLCNHSHLDECFFGSLVTWLGVVVGSTSLSVSEGQENDTDTHLLYILCLNEFLFKYLILFFHSLDKSYDQCLKGCFYSIPVNLTWMCLAHFFRNGKAVFIFHCFQLGNFRGNSEMTRKALFFFLHQGSYMIPFTFINIRKIQRILLNEHLTGAL